MNKSILNLLALTFLFISACDDGILRPEPGPLPSGTFLSQVDIGDSFRVNFSASAQNTTNIFWDFGDNFGVASGPSASYTYERSGTYTVTLTLINRSGVQDVKRELVISGPEAPIADYRFIINDAVDPLTVSFINETEFGDTYTWEFGDGQTSTETNPSHTYTASGLYSVRLIAIGVDGIKRSTKRLEFYLLNPADLAGTDTKQWGFASTLPSGTPSAYYVTNAAGQIIINSTLLECELNDRYIFSSNKTYICENQNDARLRISNFTCATFSKPATQTWNLIRNSNLQFSLALGASYIGDPTGSASYRVVSIAANRLQLQFERDAPGGLKETVHMTFEPK